MMKLDTLELDALDEEQIAELIDLCTGLSRFAPLVDAALEGALPLVRKFGPVLTEFRDWLVDSNIRSIQRDEAAGMTRDEALYLTACDRDAVVARLKNMNLKSRNQE